MDPVQKALWYVESHSREPVTLDSVARSCRVSAFHLTRAFGATTGLSLMRYVRALRFGKDCNQTGEKNRLLLGLVPPTSRAGTDSLV